MIEDVTFDGAFELFLTFGIGFGLYLLTRGIYSLRSSGRSLVSSALLAGVGVVIVAPAFIFRWSETLGIFSGIDNLPTFASLGAIAVMIGLAVGAAGLLIDHVARAIDRLLNLVTRRGDGPEWSPYRSVPGLTAVLGVSAFINLAAVVVITPEEAINLAENVSIDSSFVARYDLPGGVTALALVDDTSGYLAIGDGAFGDGIFRFDLPRGLEGGIELRSVYADISQPRGMVVIGDELFATTQNTVPCTRDYARCDGENGDFPRSTGGLYAFTIGSDGDISNPRPVVTHLPVMNFFHKVNGLELGPDGYLYMSIGSNRTGLENLDADVRANTGVVLRVKPEDGESEVFASGLRNVYALAFDDDGRLYGVDNDGASLRGFKGEEVLEIRRGDDFGFPAAGTFDRRSQRPSPAIWKLDHNVNGAAGLEWATNAGLPPGLLIGLTQTVTFLPLQIDELGPYVVNEGPEPALVTRSGHFTVLESAPNGLLFAGTFGVRKKSQLAILSFAEGTGQIPPDIQ